LEGAGQGDVVVIMAGTNDFTGNSSDEINIINQVENVLAKSTKGNVVLLGIPKRYDMFKFNNQIVNLNRTLSGLCNLYKHCSFVPLSRLRRRHYTVHGLHLNKLGKEQLSNAITENILKLNSSITFDRRRNIGNPYPTVSSVVRGSRGRASTEDKPECYKLAHNVQHKKLWSPAVSGGIWTNSSLQKTFLERGRVRERWR